MESLLHKEECKSEAQIIDSLGQRIPQVVSELVASCHREGCFAHVSPVPIPSREAMVQILLQARRILFPGYFNQTRIDPVNLPYYLGQEATALYQELSTQIAWAIRHDCYRYDQACTLCEERGQEASLQFLTALPELRRALATDVRAAYEGDPAAGSHDEVIFSYPGLFAITVYRLAHVLYEIKVPLLPRIMTEYAHGQTAVIGKGVRIYQGVTLGALSLPRQATEVLRSAKRHPTIEDEVTIYSGATILGGDTVVGARSTIGGNVWLTESVPADTKVFIKKPELIYLERK